MAQRDFGSPFDGLGTVIVLVLGVLVVLGLIGFWFVSGISIE